MNSLNSYNNMLLRACNFDTLKQTYVKLLHIMLAFSMLLFTACSGAEEGRDWPAYRHDNFRSGVTEEHIDAANLQESWVYESPAPPQTAWSGPAKWDAYARVNNLRSMRDYDSVFHVTVAGNSLFFGSSVEDAVISLDIRNGKEKWAFIADGPVRIAPAIDSGRLYFGSDDGYTYCLDAAKGDIVWKTSPSPKEPLIPSNGKYISQWPIRTGVIIENGLAYFGASLLPWKDSYLCAVDKGTGLYESDGSYRKVMENKTLEGALLATSTRLYMTQGRVSPAVFDIGTGAFLGQLPGGGGVFALITPDSGFLHGPGNKSGWITESNGESMEQTAQYPLGNAIVIKDNVSYLLTDSSIIATDRTTKQNPWSVDTDCANTMILAGDTLFAGGNDKLAAFSAVDGTTLWGARIKGRVHGIAAARGRLFASTDNGNIYCFSGR